MHVAVLDSGVDGGHTELAPNMSSLEPVNCTDSPTHGDVLGHGTYVAGVIAAVKDNSEIVGAAPQVKIWNVKVLPDSQDAPEYWSTVMCGLDRIGAESPARGGSVRVANMSFGEDDYLHKPCGIPKEQEPDVVHEQICATAALGVVIVVSAGNGAIDFRDTVPATYPEVVTVSALSDLDGLPCGLGGSRTRQGWTYHDDQFAPWSSYGTIAEDLSRLVAAPGVGVLTTAPRRFGQDRFGSFNGTSASAPHVAAWAAMYLALKPAATTAEVLAVIRSTGEPSDVNYMNDCAILPLVSHTDPTGRHPEAVVRADIYE